MEVVTQDLDGILGSLKRLDVDWRADTARAVIDKLRRLPEKPRYDQSDVQRLLGENFDEGMLILRLFLGLSKDAFGAELKSLLGQGGAGVVRYERDPVSFIEALEKLGVVEAMSDQVHRKRHWSDVLVKRLRSGRGSAISGQKRGRDVENAAEEIVQRVFPGHFAARCTFAGTRGRNAKCDFAIPQRDNPRIVIESKGYGATGSKMTDVIGDIEKIIAAKRADTAFLFLTDGIAWRERISDLRKIVAYQNQGDITRIYTLGMTDQFEKDLRQLKAECGL